MYLSYDEYVEKGGTLDETAFKALEYRAEMTVDYYTFGRIEEPSDTVKQLVYELIGVADEDIGASSMSNDGVSITYRSDYSAGERAISLVRRYLSREKTSDGTPLLYTGV